MVDSLPPSGIDPDNQTIITNSNDKLEVISTAYYLANFAQDSGDWTGIDSVEDGIATVNVPTESTASASVTADLTGIDKLNFRVRAGACSLAIEFDGFEEGSTGASSDFVTVEISGLDDYGANTTVTLIGDSPRNSGTFWIDYVHSVIQPESRIFELVDTGGLP
jgi:hypothetical protein